MMSHLLLLLFLLLPGLIYLLDCIRGDAGKTGLEAVSYAKFTSLMTTLPGTVARKVGEDLPLHFHKAVRRQQQPICSSLQGPSWMKLQPPTLVGLELRVPRWFHISLPMLPWWDANAGHPCVTQGRSSVTICSMNE